MADNIQLDVGADGEVLATDDIGGIHYQISKLAFGALNTAVLAIAGAGAVTTGTQRVTLGSDDPAVASLAIIDDWDESDRAKVNPIVGQAGIAAGAGAVAATVPRMTLASDDPAVASLGVMDDWDESNRAKVNIIAGQAGIAAGAGVVGVTVPRMTLASDDPAVLALQIIDDWDESDRAKVNPIVGQAGVAAGAGAVGVTVPRVTLASNDPAVVALQIMDDWDESDRAKVNIIAGQVGVQGASGTVTALTQRVVLATDVALPAGTEAIGKLAANVGVDIGDVTIIPKTSGGLSFFKSIDLDETEEAVKASAGQLYSIKAFNMTAAPIFLKIYNATVGTVIVGTTVPDLTIPIPANADADGAGFIWETVFGYPFGTAITVAATTGVADNDSGAPAANACIVDIGFK